MPVLRKIEIRWVKIWEKRIYVKVSKLRGKDVVSLVSFLKAALKCSHHYGNQQQAQQSILPSPFSVHWTSNIFFKVISEWACSCQRTLRSYCFAHVWLGLFFPLVLLESLMGLFDKTAFLYGLPGEAWVSSAYCFSVCISPLKGFSQWKAYQ